MCSHLHLMLYSTCDATTEHSHNGKNSVLPTSALALSMALLTANNTDELITSGGSPTAGENKSLADLQTTVGSNSGAFDLYSQIQWDSIYLRPQTKFSTYINVTDGKMLFPSCYIQQKN